MTVPLDEEASMAVPPHRTEEQTGAWEVAGERPIRGREPRPDRSGPVIVALVIVALVVALLLLFVL